MCVRLRANRLEHLFEIKDALLVRITDGHMVYNGEQHGQIMGRKRPRTTSGQTRFVRGTDNERLDKKFCPS